MKIVGHETKVIGDNHSNLLQTQNSIENRNKTLETLKNIYNDKSKTNTSILSALKSKTDAATKDSQSITTNPLQPSAPKNLQKSEPAAILKPTETKTAQSGVKILKAPNAIQMTQVMRSNSKTEIKKAETLETKMRRATGENQKTTNVLITRSPPAPVKKNPFGEMKNSSIIKFSTEKVMRLSKSPVESPRGTIVHMPRSVIGRTENTAGSLRESQLVEDPYATAGSSKPVHRGSFNLEPTERSTVKKAPSLPRETKSPDIPFHFQNSAQYLASYASPQHHNNTNNNTMEVSSKKYIMDSSQKGTGNVLANGSARVIHQPMDKSMNQNFKERNPIQYLDRRSAGGIEKTVTMDTRREPRDPLIKNENAKVPTAAQVKTISMPETGKKRMTAVKYIDKPYPPTTENRGTGRKSYNRSPSGNYKSEDLDRNIENDKELAKYIQPLSKTQ